MIKRIIKQSVGSALPLGSGAGMTLVAGMPKSGTTVIARLMGEATKMKTCSDPFHELDKQGIEYREKLYRGDLELRDLWKKNRTAFSGKIIKDPNFCFLIGQLQAIFPQAKILFIIRDPRENIRSILDRLSLPGDPQKCQNEIHRVPSTWRAVLEGKSPPIPGGDHLEKLAWRWRKFAEIYLENKNSMVLVRYEDFNKDKRAEINRLSTDLGYKVIEDISARINVQFQPKGKPVNDWSAFFGEANLKRITKIVAPLLTEFDYER